MAERHSLGKSERLKSRKRIENLFARGRQFSMPPFRVWYSVMDGNELQVGVGAGAKQFRKAVDRNRIKRLCREAWRMQKEDLQKKIDERGKSLHVFLVYTGRELPAFSRIQEKIKDVIKRLYDLVNENNS